MGSSYDSSGRGRRLLPLATDRQVEGPRGADPAGGMHRVAAQAFGVPPNRPNNPRSDSDPDPG